MKEKLVRLHLYRYQILPTNRFFQSDLYGAKTVEELIEKKNDFFNKPWDMREPSRVLGLL